MNRRRFVQTSLAAAITASLPVSQGFTEILSASMKVDADINAVTGDGAEVTLKKAAVQELGDSLQGNLLLPGHEAYEQARRVLNPSFDKRPALIAQVTGTADVRMAVDFARENRLLLAVKCGGHSAAGRSTCDGGMMIDLSPFRDVRVDPVARRARVTGGSLLGQLDHETMAYDLVTPMGTVSHTGVGGLVTGGGFGRVARRFGLSIDNLTSVDVVTADGQFRRANEQENPDIFWGVRGGGGNFGIVTSFEFRLHPMQRQVLGGPILFPIERARDVLNMYAEYGPEAPDELDMLFLMIRPPEGGSIASAVGPGGIADAVVGFGICYSGLESGAERALAPIRKLGKPLVDGIQAIDYVALQRSGDVDEPRARAWYLKSGFVPEMSAGLITDIVEGLEGHPSRTTNIVYQQGGGAIGRVSNDATAFSHRDAAGNLLLGLDWGFVDDPAEHVAWIKQFWTRLEPFTQGFYVNDGDLDAYVTDKVVRNYRQNYDRLVEIKNKYDPTNLFRLNGNIRPTV
jgi:FAD/FMN-containing dehydrogenase